MSDAIVVAEGAGLATMETAPVAVIREATAAATALRDVIARKPKPVIMNGEQYLEFEDWQTLGRFYGVTAAGVGEPEFVEPAPGIRGFKATSEALDRNGRVLSRATAYCLNDEEKWRGRTKYEWVYILRSGGVSAEDPGKDEIIWEDNPSKPGKKRPKKERQAVGEEMVPLYQLASMAQTRANSKVLRNVLSWVAVMAGYRPTPAEELPEDRRESRAEDHEERPEPRREAPAAKPAQRAQVTATAAQDGWDDPVSLARDLMARTGQDRQATEALLFTLIGVRSFKGLRPSQVREARERLAALDAEKAADIAEVLGPDDADAEREPAA